MLHKDVCKRWAALAVRVAAGARSPEAEQGAPRASLDTMLALRTAMKKAPCGDTLVVSRKTSTEEAHSICCTLDSI